MFFRESLIGHSTERIWVAHELGDGVVVVVAPLDDLGVSGGVAAVWDNAHDIAIDVGSAEEARDVDRGR